MNLTITQENVHLLLPSKLCWMANMLSEDRGISIVEAMKMLYASDVYSRLEQESTKAWHLGAVALYEEFQAGVCAGDAENANQPGFYVEPNYSL